MIALRANGPASGRPKAGRSPRATKRLVPSHEGSERSERGGFAEHEFEAAHGLPEPLPPGERILWQGAPEWRAMAHRCFHVRTFAWYFAAILAVRGVTAASQSGSAVAGVVAALWLLGPAAGAIAMLWVMAWLTSRTTVYTITDRRIVMRIGIVLSITLNLPFARIRSADASLKSGPSGDIALALVGPDQIAYVHLWPHARPWRLARTEPMLRCVEDVAGVASILTNAWRAANGADAGEPVTAADAVPASASRASSSFAHAARRLETSDAVAAH